MEHIEPPREWIKGRAPALNNERWFDLMQYYAEYYYKCRISDILGHKITRLLIGKCVESSKEIVDLLRE